MSKWIYVLQVCNVLWARSWAQRFCLSFMNYMDSWFLFIYDPQLVLVFYLMGSTCESWSKTNLSTNQIRSRNHICVSSWEFIQRTRYGKVRNLSSVFSLHQPMSCEDVSVAEPNFKKAVLAWTKFENHGHPIQELRGWKTVLYRTKIWKYHMTGMGCNQPTPLWS